MRNVTVCVEPLAREKILAFAEAVTTEIGGLMTVRQDGRTLTIEDAWTVPQAVSVGGVNFDVGHFEDHIKAKGWANGRAMPHICMGTWHSHGASGVFWSTTDENDLSRKYAMRGFLVNVVVNHRGDWYCQVDSMVGPENGKPEDYVLVTVPSTLKHITLRDNALVALVDAEIKANVREIQWPTVKGWKGWKGHDHNPASEEADWWNEWDRGNYLVEPKEAKEPRSKKSLFANAREREGNILGGVWSINKRTKCMEKWVKGKLVAYITRMGDGEMTLLDDDGQVLATDKHARRPKGFLPPAVL